MFTDTNTVYTHPNHTGDVTSSGDGTTTIGSNKVTFAKMQDIDTDTFMGRTAAGTGDAKALSVSEARTMLNVEDGATADQTAAQILAALKTVDVNGTAGINAGTFDGLPGANIPKFYNNAVLTDSASTASFIAELASDYGCFGNNQVTLKVQWSYAGSSDLVTGHATIGTLELAGCTIETWGGTYKHVRITRPNTGTGGHMVVEYNDQSSGYSPGWREIWTSESDGAGSGLDADKLDGQQGTHYLAYANFTGTPTIPSGNQIIDWTTDQGVTNIHSGNYTDTNTTEFNIQAETGSVQAITAGNTVTFTASGAASVSRTGNTIDISSTNTNTTYTAGTGLSLTGTEFTNSAPDQTVALTGSGATTVTGTYPNFTISSTDTNTDTNTWNANAAGVAGYVAVPVANKVWKTDGSGNPAWRNDAEGSSATGTVTSVTATANTGLTVTNTTTTPVITLDSTLTTLGSATFTTLNVDILDADKILTRDIRVGPTGQTGGVDNAAKINGTTLTGSGAALNETGDFFVGNSASAHMFFDQSAGTLAMKSGTSGARTEIVGGTTKVYDSSNNVRVIIGDLS